MKIENLRVNHLKNPRGYDMGKKQHFSWTVREARGTKAEASRLLISSDPEGEKALLDTGFCSGIRDPFYITSLKLEPRKIYYWKAAVRSDIGEEAWSDTASFETGKMGESWEAEWISCDSEEPRHPVFFRDFSSSEAVKSARLYICALGLYEASLNGKRVGEEYLTPYCNNYERWLQYQSYDVTALLEKNNRLEVMLGNGWYKGRFGFSGKKDGYYGNEWLLIAELRLVYEDGSEEIIGTDESWKLRRSGIYFSNLYDGEYCDENLRPAEEERVLPASDDAGLKAKLTERLSPPVVVTDLLTPKLIHTPKGETVLDTGQNAAGIFRLNVRSKPGQTIRLQFGEVLQDGNFYRDNYRSAKAEYRFTSAGGEKILEPKFTFYGGRYVKVEGIEALKADDFRFLVLSTDLEAASSFETGHPGINQLLSNIEWGRKSNFIDVPTDCPQRDEKMGWTGDAQVFAASALFLTKALPFYRKYLRDMRTEQEALQGKVPNVIPSFDVKGCSAAWGDAATVIPQQLYRFSGDPLVLEEHYPLMKDWVDFIRRTDEGAGRWREHFHFGDWLALDNKDETADNRLGATDKGFIADVCYMHSSALTASAARILEREEEAARYEKLASEIRARIEASFYRDDGSCLIQTQTALLLSLRHGLGDEEKAAADLRRLFEASEGKLQTGFVGTPLLLPVLSDFGMEDIAAGLLLNEDYPGWLYEVNLGATTVWERWNSLNPEGEVTDIEMNSFNHYAYGAVLEWLYGYAAGLKPRGAGFGKLRLEPMIIPELKRLSCRYDSARGLWESSWSLNPEKQITYSCRVPFGCEAKLRLPGFSQEGELSIEEGDPERIRRTEDGSLALKSGAYTLRYFFDFKV